MKNKVQLFEQHKVRTVWDEENEKWWFSILDVVTILTDQADSRGAHRYWSVLKTRLKREGSQLATNCSQLKLRAEDGKMRLTSQVCSPGVSLNLWLYF
jgi:prophage antirepressor-like protein